jgi:hypothetical protein
MKFDTISTTWANLNENAKIIILTEADRWEIAEKIKQDNESFVWEIKLFDIAADDYKKQVDTLSENDLLIVMLTVKSFMDGYGEKFSPFNKSPDLKCKYIFIRLDIPEKALLSGINTDFNKVEKIVTDLKAIKNGSKLRVTTDKGMDITTCVNYQEIFAYSAQDLGGNAFLPPSEVANDLFQDSTNGTIIADITVGEFRIRGELIDELGIVDEPVIIKIENGQVKDVSGGKMAERLKKCFAMLPADNHVVVELGHGLSDIEPTGIIGVDESMNGTCHIGIGNRELYHLDVVIKDPKITVID